MCLSPRLVAIFEAGIAPIFKCKHSGPSPVISAVQMADQMKQAAGHTGDARMQALAAGAAALNVYNNAGAIADSASALANGNPAQAGIGISVTVGSSKSSSWQEMRDDQARG